MMYVETCERIVKTAAYDKLKAEVERMKGMLIVHDICLKCGEKLEVICGLWCCGCKE